MKGSPTFLDRAISWVAPTIGVNRAIARHNLTLFGYDAAEPGTKRGRSGGLGKNASSESPRMQRNRVELMWDARDLSRNMPVLSCALDRMVQYVVGELTYRSLTGDPDIDRSYEVFFEDWATNMSDYSGRHDFRTMVELALKAALCDGDHGWILARDQGVVQIQGIEADRIGDPMKIGSDTTDSFTAGVAFDPVTGRPNAYHVYHRDPKSNAYRFEQAVPAANFVHLWKPNRVDEYRGVTWLASVLAQSRDLYEFFSMERGAAKWAASIAGVIHSNDPKFKMGGGNTWDGRTQDGTPTSKITPNQLLRLKDGEDVTPFVGPTRPAGAFLNYVESSIRDIAMGLNVPFGFFDMARFGGATARLEVQQWVRTNKRWQMILTRAMNRVKDAVIDEGISRRQIKAHPNRRWGTWRFGSQVTADLGYQTQADINLLQNGLTTASLLSDQYGGDYEDNVKKRVAELRFAMDEARAQGLPLELVAPQLFGGATQLESQANPPPPAPPTITTSSEKTTQQVLDIIESVGVGTMPREQAIALLTQVYHYPPARAAKLVPETGETKPEPAPAARPAAKPKPNKAK